LKDAVQLFRSLGELSGLVQDASQVICGCQGRRVIGSEYPGSGLMY